MTHSPSLPIPQHTCAQALVEAYATLASKCPKLAGMVQRMDQCRQNQLARDLTGTVTGVRHAHWRCRARLCPGCQEERNLDEYADLSQAYDTARANTPGLTTDLVTITSAPFDLAETAETVDQILSRWPRMQARKPFRYAVAGYARGLQLTTVPTTGQLRAHVNCVILQQRPHAIHAAGGWLELWNTSGDGAPASLSHYAVLPAGQARTPDVDAFFQQVSAVAIQPDKLCEVHDGTVVCNRDRLVVVHGALHFRRLIYFAGCLSR